ncbi:hypothetical protein Micbo1qcDRAFT_24126 [Microdochium bolleyi]|uniref:Uncharacterized protein n=1 Tax=Microdochium bolleyi TaxID=196109 RepID=A0A136JD55_9PEZI|nr:hypothetical protein Micbo1qcDRAFT_24126 [Microdochium bolleyi]
MVVGCSVWVCISCVVCRVSRALLRRLFFIILLPALLRATTKEKETLGNKRFVKTAHLSCLVCRRVALFPLSVLEESKAFAMYLPLLFIIFY